MIIHRPQAANRLASISAYWRAANYLGASQLYLRDNVLLKRPLQPADIKPRLLGHWGTQPGLNLVYAHLNRLVQDRGAQVLLVVGPGHGAPAILANLFLEGTLGEFYPEFKPDAEGMQRLMRAFSWPHGLPSHLGPMVPGTIHEGGELGYSLAHAFGAALDNPNLLVACIVGDGEAETGPLATAWHSPKFFDAATSGAVLPIFHLNGYKLSAPTIFARMSGLELHQYFYGLGYEMRLVAPQNEEEAHRQLWEAMDWAYERIGNIQATKRRRQEDWAQNWPVIVLKTLKGWTGPHEIDGKPIEGTFHAHQLPITDPATNPAHLRALEHWLRSYEPEQLFDEDGQPVDAVTSLVPDGPWRIGMNPHAHGGNAIALDLPQVQQYELAVRVPGSVDAEATRELGGYLRDIFKRNEIAANFRLFSPDETMSNRLERVFEVTQRGFERPLVPTDEALSPTGRVMEMLSEHSCAGWLEGYVLTGRHGVFACYEAFSTIVDSMVTQHAKWLKVAREVPWRGSIPSLNYLLTSHAWRQDHNGYSHQGPGFIDTLISKKSSIVRVYLPPDANCLLSVMEHCLRSRDYINLIIASKNLAPQWLEGEAAREHCIAGASIWPWASNAGDAADVDIVIAAAGDVPTTEAIAATSLLNTYVPDLRVRVVNVVDLCCLERADEHPHGLDDARFETLFTSDKPVIFAFHGYPRVIHELIHGRSDPGRFHVRGYIEEGSTTTPFDMLVCNQMSRYHLALEALRRAGTQGPGVDAAVAFFRERLRAHEKQIIAQGVDLPEITSWRFQAPRAAG
jgi:xylulose-5-phosphate/fructose-6-phosphate phosphoketolase